MKRDLIVTALLAFCLTATIFMVATSQSAEYDPWADLNGDGRIDIFDVVGMTSRYAATGDPTKNVTISGHVNKLAYSNSTSVAVGDPFHSPWISVDGYSKVTICIYNGAGSTNRYRLSVKHTGVGNEFYADEITNFGFNLVKTYDVPNQMIQVVFSNFGGASTPFNLDVYLIA